jgi:transcriptional regulator with XRE-family HTH domain
VYLDETRHLSSEWAKAKCDIAFLSTENDELRLHNDMLALMFPATPLEEKPVSDVSFGTHLRNLRRMSGLTQQKLAESAGIDHTYLSKIENGRVLPPSAVLIKRMAQLVDGDEEAMLKLAEKPHIAQLRSENKQLRAEIESLKRQLGTSLPVGVEEK